MKIKSILQCLSIIVFVVSIAVLLYARNIIYIEVLNQYMQIAYGLSASAFIIALIASVKK